MTALESADFAYFTLSKFSARFFALRILPLMAAQVMMSTVSFAGESGTPNDLNIKTELYSQSMFRPDERRDRAHGVFHETRLRSSFTPTPMKSLSLDLGSYLLAEWSQATQVANASTNAAVSPYVGAHWSVPVALGPIDSGDTLLSFTVQFEGRYREPISDFSRSTGIKGWDPRTGVAFGVWHLMKLQDFNLFFDLYADAFYAPKFSTSSMTSATVRIGNRFLGFDLESLFVDLYVENFYQNAASIELGTKRTELRLGTAIGVLRDSGSLQIRVYGGVPFNDTLDSRSRVEALLVGGLTL